MILSLQWQRALKQAAERRDFPSLLFAEKWLRALARTGVFGRWYDDGRGE